MKYKKGILATVLTVVLALAGFAAEAAKVPSANAAVDALMSTISLKSGNPAPSCPAPYVFSGKKASCVPCPQGSKYDKSSKTCKGPTAMPAPAKCTTSTDAKGVKTTTCVSGVRASASDIDTGRVTILGYIQVNGIAKAIAAKLEKQGKCFWVGRGSKYPNFTNSGARNGSGKYGKFADSRRTRACRTGKGPTGIQKEYDINPKTGEKENFCANYLWLHLVKNLIKGKVEVVRSLANVLMHLHAESHVRVTSPSCPGTYAEGFGQADITITLNEYMRTRGSVSSSISASAYGRATSNAKASVVCAPGTTTVQTVTTGTTTNVTTNITTTTSTTTTSTPPPTFTMSFDTINDIPAGTCRPETLHVTTSVTGQVKVYPNAGLISTVDCKQPATGQLSQVMVSVGTGTHDYVVYVYEPTDQSATSDTLTGVPLISGVDAKNNTATTSFTVSHPTRA